MGIFLPSVLCKNIGIGKNRSLFLFSLGRSDCCAYLLFLAGKITDVTRLSQDLPTHRVIYTLNIIAVALVTKEI